MYFSTNISLNILVKSHGSISLYPSHSPKIRWTVTVPLLSQKNQKKDFHHVVPPYKAEYDPLYKAMRKLKKTSQIVVHGPPMEQFLRVWMLNLRKSLPGVFWRWSKLLFKNSHIHHTYTPITPTLQSQAEFKGGDLAKKFRWRNSKHVWRSLAKVVAARWKPRRKRLQERGIEEEEKKKEEAPKKKKAFEEFKKKFAEEDMPEHIVKELRSPQNAYRC